MNPLDRQSEQYSPTGSIAAEGVKNQLGRPHLSRMAVLVREAVQNSWDARALEEGGVTFGLSSWTATADQLQVLQHTAFSSVPPKLELSSCLQQGSVRLLAVYDRGTNGLGGPTRADVVPEPGEPTDFVDFLRNIGQPPDRDYGGGTYGFGKAAFYLASKARTIIVHTRCSHRGEIESRFIAAALGSQYEDDHRTRFTGRHWWGRFSGPIAEPLVGADADDMALALGFPDFAHSSTGTTIVVVEPDFEGAASVEAAFEEMRDTILRYFWPKCIDGANGNGTINFELALDGGVVELPRPDRIPELSGFVQAFRGFANPSSVNDAIFGGRVSGIDCQRPRKHLGQLALIRFAASEKRSWGLSEAHSESPINEPFGRPAHHVALLRTPNFVVRYVEGPSAPSSRIEYAGVFRATREVDGAFAMAEPPTHDDWIPDMLEGGAEKTYVRVALRRIKDTLREFASPPSVQEPTSLDLPLGALSDRLGGLIPAENGIGAREHSGDGKHGSASRAKAGGGAGAQLRGKIRVLEPTMIEMVDGRPALIVSFDALHGGGEPLPVTVTAGVLLEGGGVETDPPAGADRASILEWRGPGGHSFGPIAQCVIPPELGGRWSVAVSIPSDAMITVSVTTRRQPD